MCNSSTPFFDPLVISLHYYTSPNILPYRPMLLQRGPIKGTLTRFHNCTSLSSVEGKISSLLFIMRVFLQWVLVRECVCRELVSLILCQYNLVARGNE